MSNIAILAMVSVVCEYFCVRVWWYLCLLKLSLKYIWFPVQLSSLVKILSRMSFQHTRSAVIQKGCAMCNLTKLL